jgi:hypothetical protein
MFFLSGLFKAEISRVFSLTFHLFFSTEASPIGVVFVPFCSLKKKQQQQFFFLFFFPSINTQKQLYFLFDFFFLKEVKTEIKCFFMEAVPASLLSFCSTRLPCHKTNLFLFLEHLEVTRKTTEVFFVSFSRLPFLFVPEA